MGAVPSPLAFFLLLLSGWVNRQQQAVIDYLLEENRILRAERGSRRLRLTDDQRRRLAVKGKALGRRRLGDIAGIVTPDAILRWYRRLVAKKYAGSKKRVPSRPAPSRVSPPSWSAWRTRTRLGATRESAVR
jgi:putative transposase